MDTTVVYIAGAVVAVALPVALQFALAPMVAVRRRVKRVRILWGMAEYVVWDPNEVLIIRRGGKIWKSDEDEAPSDDGDKKPSGDEAKQSSNGGARFIYPLFGEDVRARVSLAVKSLTWRDTVNIQEAIPCNIEVAVWWAVDDVSEYFFRNDLEAHPDAGRKAGARSEEEAARDTAEADLKKLTGARVRKVASNVDFQISLIEMLILKQSEYRAVQPGGVAPDSNARAGAANMSANLTHALRAELNPDELNKEAKACGLRVERVEVQSIDWATEVQRPVLEMLLGRLRPERARSQAEAEGILADAKSESYAKRLSDISKVLGVPVTQMRELLQHLPDGASDTRDELAQAIISEFKRLNPQSDLPRPKTKADELEPRRMTPTGMEANGFKSSEDEPEG